jgi:hypothetical protein
MNKENFQKNLERVLAKVKYDKIAKAMKAIGWGVYQNTPGEEDMRKTIVWCFDKCIEELEASNGHATYYENGGFKVTVCKTDFYVQVEFILDCHWADTEADYDLPGDED